jgi:hypothetical protein
LISSFLVIVGFGHGIGPIFITEAGFPFWIKDYRLNFSVPNSDNAENVVMFADIFFFIGQVFLLIYLRLKKTFLLWIGIFILWFGIFILIQGEGGILFLFGLPFIILSIISCVRSIMEMRAMDEEALEE